jgi:hypothetical protein
MHMDAILAMTGADTFWFVVVAFGAFAYTLGYQVGKANGRAERTPRARTVDHSRPPRPFDG